MYKIASDRRQAALRRGRLADWINGEERQTDEELRSNLVRAAANIERRLLAEENPIERKCLGVEKLSLQKQIESLNKRLKAANIYSAGLDSYIGQAMREVLTRAQRELVLGRARRLFDENRARAEEIFAATQEVSADASFN